MWYYRFPNCNQNMTGAFLTGEQLYLCIYVCLVKQKSHINRNKLIIQSGSSGTALPPFTLISDFITEGRLPHTFLRNPQ